MLGMVNIQFVLYQDQVYVIEVNPRSSRTVPYISKVTNVPVVDLATKVILGHKLKDLGFGTGVYPEANYVAVKVPVFSFPKLSDADVHLGPEMKSTGEVLGIGKDFETAMFKGLIGAGYELHKVGDTVLITVKEEDRAEAVPLAKKFIQFGYQIRATDGTAKYLNEHGVPAKAIAKISEPYPNILDLFETGDVDFMVNTSKIGRKPAVDSVQMRRKAIERNIATMTSIDTANALANCLLMHKTIDDFEMIDIVSI